MHNTIALERILLEKEQRTGRLDLSALGVRLIKGALASNSQEVDISSLSAGIYFLVVHAGDQPAVTKKIVVLK